MITSVCERWETFANENGAPGLDATSFVGRLVWDFVAGAEVRLLYLATLQRIRDNDTPVIFPFRCDSPDRRRLMRLVISPIRSPASRPAPA